MSAKIMLGLMVAGTALVMSLGARHEPAAHAPPPVHDEVPWLTKEAAAQIVAPGGAPGPLFDGVHLGLPVPAEEADRIAAFAKANNVELGLEIVEGDLAAIRFTVSYGGCCGYEGADVLAARMGRPETGHCCVCGPNTWIDDWTVIEDGIRMRGRVRVNRVSVRWEKPATLAEIVERADSLLGADRDAVARAAGDRWSVIEPNRRFLLEVPFPTASSNDYGVAPRLEDRLDMVLLVTARAGVITEISFTLRDPDRGDDEPSRISNILEARWGRAKRGEYEWTWRKQDRVVSSTIDSFSPIITIRNNSR
jgi:hypothetical protein